MKGYALIKSNPCTNCGSIYHTKAFCPLIKRKPIKKVGKRGEANIEFSKQWRKSLDPDKTYECYLQISPLCPKYINVHTAYPEHVVPKSRGKEYAFDLKNIRPACYYCNSLKGSRTIESLIKEYPHLKSLTWN